MRLQNRLTYLPSNNSRNLANIFLQLIDLYASIGIYDSLLLELMVDGGSNPILTSLYATIKVKKSPHN